MLNLYEELRRVIGALDAARVPYALAGGLAVSIYAEPRATQDIDVLVAPEDLDRVTAAVSPLGYARAGSPMRAAGGRLAIQRFIKIEGTDLLPLDFLLPIDPALSYVLADRVSLEVEGGALWVVGIKSLRDLKRLRGSMQDRADLEALGEESP